MQRAWILLGVLLLVPGAALAQSTTASGAPISEADREAITRAALDYVEGWY